MYTAHTVLSWHQSAQGRTLALSNTLQALPIKDIDPLAVHLLERLGKSDIELDADAGKRVQLRVEADGSLASPIAKNFSTELLAEFARRMEAQPDDLLLFVADQEQPPGLVYWAVPPIGALLWPWVFVTLRKTRRHFKVI